MSSASSRGDGSQIAVARFRRMHEMRRCPRRGEGGGDLASDMARFAHSADDNAAQDDREWTSTARLKLPSSDLARAPIASRAQSSTRRAAITSLRHGCRALRSRDGKPWTHCRTPMSSNQPRHRTTRCAADREAPLKTTARWRKSCRAGTIMVGRAAAFKRAVARRVSLP